MIKKQGFEWGMSVGALALVACGQTTVPIGHDALPSDATSGGSGGAASAEGGKATTAAGSGGAATTGGVGSGGAPSTGPALWVFDMPIQILCDGPSAVGWTLPDGNAARWSPEAGVVTLPRPPGVREGASVSYDAANSDCSVVATVLAMDPVSTVVRWSGSGPGTIISDSRLLPLNQLVASADLSVIASAVTEDTGSGPKTRVPVWRDGAVTDLPLPAGFNHMRPWNTNAAGTVFIGDVSKEPYLTLQNFDLENFLWTAATGTIMPLEPGCRFSQLTRDGNRAFGTCGNETSAFGWEMGSGTFSLGAPPPVSAASRIVPWLATEDGSVVTGTYEGDPGGLFIWRKGQGFELFRPPGLPPTYRTTEASGISADGRVVVALMTDEDRTSRAVRWSESAGLSELEVPANDICSPTSLSKDGQIAAGVCQLGGDGSRHYAVLWDADGKLRRLDAVLTAAGIDLNGEELAEATVHESGRFVWGNLASDVRRSYVARLPSE